MSDSDPANDVRDRILDGRVSQFFPSFNFRLLSVSVSVSVSVSRRSSPCFQLKNRFLQQRSSSSFLVLLSNLEGRQVRSQAPSVSLCSSSSLLPNSLSVVRACQQQALLLLYWQVIRNFAARATTWRLVFPQLQRARCAQPLA